MSSSSLFATKRVAELARLELSSAEAIRIQTELTSILQFVEVINELDLEGVEPFFGFRAAMADAPKSPLRNDLSAASVSRDRMLSNAPVSDGQFYLVPPVFDSTAE